jgi:hypothetical protein
MTDLSRRASLLALLVLVLGALAAATASAATPTANPTDMRQLSDEQLTTKWAYPAYRGRVYSRPTKAARNVTRLRLLTEDQFPQPYVVLADWADATGARWMKIRLPGRPNGRTGWVTESSLGDLSTVHTQLVVNRKTLRVTLFSDGKQIFQAPVGVGKASTQTPAGHFWVTEKFRRSPTGPAAASSACTAPTSPGASRGVRRTAASACTTATSRACTASCPRARRS